MKVWDGPPLTRAGRHAMGRSISTRKKEGVKTVLLALLGALIAAAALVLAFLYVAGRLHWGSIPAAGLLMSCAAYVWGAR